MTDSLVEEWALLCHEYYFHCSDGHELPTDKTKCLSEERKKHVREIMHWYETVLKVDDDAQVVVFIRDEEHHEPAMLRFQNQCREYFKTTQNDSQVMDGFSQFETIKSTIRQELHRAIFQHKQSIFDHCVFESASSTQQQVLPETIDYETLAQLITWFRSGKSNPGSAFPLAYQHVFHGIIQLLQAQLNTPEHVMGWKVLDLAFIEAGNAKFIRKCIHELLIGTLHFQFENPQQATDGREWTLYPHPAWSSRDLHLMLSYFPPLSSFEMGPGGGSLEPQLHLHRGRGNHHHSSLWHVLWRSKWNVLQYLLSAASYFSWV